MNLKTQKSRSSHGKLDSSPFSQPFLPLDHEVALLGLVLGALSATFPAQLLARLVLGAALAEP